MQDRFLLVTRRMDGDNATSAEVIRALEFNGLTPRVEWTNIEKDGTVYAIIGETHITFRGVDHPSMKFVVEQYPHPEVIEHKENT